MDINKVINEEELTQFVEDVIQTAHRFGYDFDYCRFCGVRIPNTPNASIFSIKHPSDCLFLLAQKVQKRML